MWLDPKETRPYLMKTILATQLYNPKNEEREEELKLVLEENIKNVEIDHIILITDENIKHKKINTVKLETRPTYADLFEQVNKTKIAKYKEEDCLLIVSNSDIYFQDGDITKIKNNINDTQAYALSRWDHTKEGLIHHKRPDSQDAWVVKNQFKKGNYGITLGLPGCDNRIAAELKNAGYIVLNPSLDIKIIHYHYPRYNTYTPEMTLYGEYHFIEPTGI